MNVEKKVIEMWGALGVPRVDLSTTPEHLAADITRNGHTLDAVREWVKGHAHRKTLSHDCTYVLKHEAERAVGQWVPHSVLIFAAWLEGHQLDHWRVEGGAGVFQTTIGKMNA